MKSSQTARDYSAASAPPSMEAARQALADHIASDAIDAYELARRRYDAYIAAIDADEQLSGLEDLAGGRLGDARNHLVRVLLDRGPRVTPLSERGEGLPPEKIIHPPCGVIAGGKVYLASVTPEYVDDPVGSSPSNRGEPLMGLTVADLADVGEMELTQFDDLDGGPTRPVPPAPGAVPEAEPEEEEDEYRDDGDGNRKWFHRPMAFARGSHTFSDPGDRCPVTLEFVVVSNAPGSASVADLPELQQAGWREDEFGPLTVFTRVHW